MTLKRIALGTATALGLMLAAGTASAACNATMNGRPMTMQECAWVIQVYGFVVPGNYAADAAGNWVNLNNPSHRGNIYADARRSRGGGGGGGSWYGRNTSGVFDGSGGCEGGSCVNILD